MSAPTKPIRVTRVASGTKRVTFSASHSRWDRSCRTTVAPPHPFKLTMASNTCLYWSQLVNPLNLGTFVVVNAAGLGRVGGVHVAGIVGTGGASFSAWISFRNCAMVSIRSACCGLRKSAPNCVFGLGHGHPNCSGARTNNNTFFITYMIYSTVFYQPP